MQFTIGIVENDRSKQHTENYVNPTDKNKQ